MNREINKVMRSKINFSLSALILLALFVFLGCGEEEVQEGKSMEDLQNENGIPVVVKEVQPEHFKKELTFFSQISGIKQTTRAAAVGGRVEKINYKVGDFVKKDAIVVEFPEDNPAVQYEQAKAAFENSKKTYERMKTLLEAGETAQANFDGAETKYLVDKRNYEMAKQALFIDAPYDGTIVEIMVNVGDGVDSKAPLFTIANLGKVKTKIWASEDEIKLIRKGMTAEINQSGKSYAGRVTETSISMDPMKRAYYAEVEFDNSNAELKPGSSTEISILIYENDETVVVPRNLIQSSRDEKFVFVVEENKAEKRILETGRENGLSVEVVDGLFPGDKLIVKGANMVTDGQTINEVQ